MLPRFCPNLHGLPILSNPLKGFDSLGVRNISPAVGPTINPAYARILLGKDPLPFRPPLYNQIIFAGHGGGEEMSEQGKIR